MSSADGPGATHTPLIRRISASARERLLTLGTLQVFDRGERLMGMGEPGDCVMVITAGVVKVVGEDATGASVILDIDGAGDVVGEAAVISQGVRMASVVAVGEVEARRIGGREFNRFLDDFPDVSKELLVTVLRRFSTAQAQRSVAQAPLSLSRVAQRLEYLLEICGKAVPDGWEIAAPLSRDELAAFVPTGRTSLITSLTALSKRGIVRRSRMAIVVTDRAALRALAREYDMP